MSVDALVAAVRRAVGLLPFGALRAADQDLEAAQETLGQCAAGSSAAELPEAVQGLGEARQTLGTTYQACDQVRRILEHYLDSLGAGTPPAAPAPTPAGSAQPTTPPAGPNPVADGQRLDPKRVAQLQADLPPPVVARAGQKTHGRWVDERGNAHEIVSGRDEDAAEAWRILRERGIPVRTETTTVADVEQKLAARMVREGRTHLDIVLNNRPCKGLFGCDTLLPVILPEGYTLTVHAPNYRKTFTGGAKPWSR